MKLNERCSGPRFDPGQVHQKHSPQVSDDNRSGDEKEFRVLLMGLNLVSTGHGVRIWTTR